MAATYGDMSTNTWDEITLSQFFDNLLSKGTLYVFAFIVNAPQYVLRNHITFGIFMASFRYCALK